MMRTFKDHVSSANETVSFKLEHKGKPVESTPTYDPDDSFKTARSVEFDEWNPILGDNEEEMHQEKAVRDIKKRLESYCIDSIIDILNTVQAEINLETQYNGDST